MHVCVCVFVCVTVIDEFKCPITCEVMKDPVVAAGENFTSAMVFVCKI